MEYKKEKKISFFRLLISKLFSTKTNILLLQKFISESKNNNIINNFDVIKDTVEINFNNHFIRYIIKLSRNTKKNDDIICTGIGSSQSTSVIKAYAEATERLIFLQNPILKNYYSFTNRSYKKDSFHMTNTNGIAFHSNLTDCFLNSFYELIERHFLIYHWYTKSPAIKLLSLDNNSKYLSNLLSLKNYLLNNDSNFNVFILNQTGPIYIVGIVATSKSGKLGYHALSAFAAHHNLLEAINRAYNEFMVDFLTKPINKIKKDYSNFQNFTELYDHLLYFQSPDKTIHFDFLTKNVETIKNFQLNKKVNLVKTLLKVLELAKEFDLKLWDLSLPSTLEGHFCFKASSNRMLEVYFGQDHNKFDVNLLKNINGKNINLNIPHPLA